MGRRETNIVLPNTPRAPLADRASLVNVYRRLRDYLRRVMLQLTLVTDKQSLGILSNDDGKESGKKAIGLDWQNNMFYGRATRFCCTFLCRHCTDTT